MDLVPILIFGKSIVEMIKKIGQNDLHFFRHKIISGFVWKTKNVRETKNKQMRIIIFLGLDNMENSKGKNVEEKNGYISLFNLPHILTCSFDSGFALIICVLMFGFFLNNLIFLVKVRLLWVCLVLENLDERGKEIERKNMEGNKYDYC